MILILLIMFCAHFTSSYDSTDDVLCTHRIVVWFCWWCSVHTSHRCMILLAMFCAHIASWYDSTDDVLLTHFIVVWFYWWCSVHTSHHRIILLTMFCARIALALWFHGWCSVHTSHRIMILPKMFWADNNSYNASRLWFQKRVHMFTRHKSSDSSDDPCVHIALQPMIQRSFHVTK